MTAWTHHRARIAGLRRQGRPGDDPQVIDARRDLVAARLAHHIRTVTAAGPSLTLTQRRDLVTLLLTEAVTDVPA